MAFIRGENVILFVYDGGQWKPIICARNCSLSTNAETIETSISGSGVWRTYEYTGLTWSANLDGAIYLDGVNELTASDLRALQFGRQKILIRYQRTDEAGNVYTEEGNAIITSISDSGEYTNINTYTVDLVGTGPLTIIYTPTPINPTAKVKRLEYNGISGETFFSNSALIGKDIMEVVVDGIGRSEILTFGTPTGQQVKYTSGTGRLDFPMGLETGTEVYVLYQDI